MGHEDLDFLQVVSQALERLRRASEERGHAMLASMIELARTEAEDDLRTRALEYQRFAEFKAGANPLHNANPKLDRPLSLNTPRNRQGSPWGRLRPFSSQGKPSGTFGGPSGAPGLLSRRGLYSARL